MNFLSKQESKPEEPVVQFPANAEPESPASNDSTETQPRPSADCLKKNDMNAMNNTLSKDVVITGSITFSKELTIDGTIEGEVISDGTLTVAKNARIKGDIRTESVTVYGTVEGNITVTGRAELKADAALIGDLQAGSLCIEQGATFVGSSATGSRNSQAIESAADAEPEESYSPDVSDTDTVETVDAELPDESTEQVPPPPPAIGKPLQSIPRSVRKKLAATG